MNNNAALPFSHNQEWVTAEALAFVRGASPWFLYMNPTAPHSPSVQEALENYNLTATPQGTLASPPDAGTTPSRADLWSRATTARPNKGAAKVAGALWVDDAVGAMLGELQTLGSLDQTLVIFSMDHGMKAKGALWEQGTRIALFVRYPPAFAAGAVIGGAVSNIDFAPTLYALAAHGGASLAPYDFDGQSLVTVHADGTLAAAAAAAAAAATPRVLFFEEGQSRAVLAGDYKLIHREIEVGCASGGAKSDTYYPAAADTEQLY